MADEEVIILDEEEGDSEGEAPKKSKRFQFSFDKKKLLQYGGLVLVLLIAILLFIVVVSSSSPEEEVAEEDAQEVAQKLLEEPRKPIDLPQLEQMIRKANVLYAQGSKPEALELFKTISVYSESISNYNLGVAQMKEESYSEAMGSFQKSIDLGEDRCYSALNAAVCAYKLGRFDLFAYYIELAETFLPEAGKDPLYPYLAGLVHYYQKNYLEALTPLKRQSEVLYQSDSDHLMAGIYLLYGDELQAITHLEKHPLQQDHFALGLLYARIGEYNLALEHLSQTLDSNRTNTQELMAMALVNIKRGAMEEASGMIKRALNADEENAPAAYPIGVRLKDTLFDINQAQERFAENFNLTSFNAYQIIFYYAPYRVFDAKEALRYIAKGGVDIYINEIQEAKDILVKGSTISRVNRTIAQALQLSLQHKIRDANHLLLEVVQRYPRHSILHYNLALTYAQMADFDNAYRHFLHAYHLNSRDLLSGVFALMCARATYRETGRINDQIAADIDDFDGSEMELQFILALKTFIQGNYSSALEWLQTDKEPKPLYLALDTMIAHHLGDNTAFLNTAQVLQQLHPGDMMAEIFLALGRNKERPIKEFSLRVQEFFKRNDLQMDSIYYGPTVTREMYITLAYITGTLHYVKERLEDRIQSESKDARGVMQALALANIYLQEFEEAYVMYNQLIDVQGEKDTHTLFLAAVASIGAKHHANAIALLELSKLTDPSNFEGRYALGLLYQEAENLQSASIQYGKISQPRFQSEYFDFQIVPPSQP